MRGCQYKKQIFLSYPARTLPPWIKAHVSPAVSGSCWRCVSFVVFLPSRRAQYFLPGRSILVTLDPCANQQPVADFSASVVSLNPPQIVLNDKSTCANQWQWKVNNPTLSYYYQSSIKGPDEKNIVVTLPSPGVYTVMLRTGRNCPGCPEGDGSNLMHCCVYNGYDYLYGEKTRDVTVTASITTPPTTPVTTPATQPPQSLPATTSPTALVTQQTQQQSATSVAPAQTTAPAATTFAPAPPGQVPGRSPSLPVPRVQRSGSITR